MNYITLDIFDDGHFKHKDWVCNAVCETRFSYLIKFIVEEETKDFINNQPKRLNPEDARNSVCDSLNSENK